MMTEDEAKTKICHQAMKAQGHCFGSQCMAWRWSRAKETKAFLDAVQDQMKKSGKDFNVCTNDVFRRDGAKFDQVEGFCGLAGKP